MNDLRMNTGGGRSNGLYMNDPFKPNQVYDDFYFNSGAGDSKQSPFDTPSYDLCYENGHLFHSMERPKRRQVPACSRVNYQMMNGNYLLQHPVASCSKLT